MSSSVQKHVKLNNGASIPLIALGVYQTPRNITAEVVYHALDIGYRHFDCAEWYENEKEVADGISNWLKAHEDTDRSEIFFTTKLFDDHQGYMLSKKAINACLSKVRRIHYIDMILIHSPQTDKETRLGTWRALQEAVKEGKVKSIGVSNYGVHHLQELLLWDGLIAKPVVNQVELHPWMMRSEIVNFCKDHDIALEAYCPLARAEKMDDVILKKMGVKYKKTQAQILLRWSLQMGFIPLPKTISKQRAIENFNVFDFEIEEPDMLKISHPEAYERTGGWDPVHYQG